MLATALVFFLVSKPEAPKGFRHASDLEIWRLGSTQIDDVCFEVTLVNDRVRVETRADFVARMRQAVAAEKSSEPKHKIFLGHATGTWSPGEGVKVADGWLQGWDVGHYGGGLYWFSIDGSKYKKLDDHHTSALTTTPKGIYAFQGAAFFELRYSRFVQVEQVDGQWCVRVITDLHEAPQAIHYTGGRYLYVGSQYVSTMELNGTQRVIVRSARELVAGGMVERKNGEVWIGNSRSLLCLQPIGNAAYQHYWFRPTTRNKNE